MVVGTKNKRQWHKNYLFFFFFVIFKKTQSSKPKISQLKTYLQETPRIKIFFRFKANGWTLYFFETRFVANSKKKKFLWFFYNVLFNQNHK